MTDLQTIRIQRLELALAQRDVTIRTLTTERDRARDVALVLEQENARLVETIRGDQWGVPA